MPIQSVQGNSTTRQMASSRSDTILLGHDVTLRAIDGSVQHERWTLFRCQTHKDHFKKRKLHHYTGKKKLVAFLQFSVILDNYRWNPYEL